MPVKYLTTIFLLLVLIECRNNPEKTSGTFRPDKIAMTDLNRYFVQKDRERIQNFIERKKLKMTESSTGLWYQIIYEEPGATFTEGDKIILDYDCSLLDGTNCYSSKKLGPKEVILGKSEMESGLNEGLRRLKPGSEAIFIIPPFLAYGLRGDGKMIPSRAIIVYKVNILRTR
jgi:FKBP-type peptidyl-prolyl cis-trans isomerase